MKQLYKHLLSAATVIAFLVIAVASSNVKSINFSPTDNGVVPPDIGAPGDTLLVIKSRMVGDANHYLRKRFSAYAGAYKIIGWNDGANYPVEGYRYTFELVQNPSKFIYSDNHQGLVTVSCAMMDRLTGKIYKTPGTNYYGPVLTAYVDALNKAIQKR